MIIRCSHLVCSAQQTILDGALVCQNGVITAIGSFANIHSAFPTMEITKFTQSCILPGLINAHCHLELSLLKDKLPKGPDFAGWIKAQLDTRKTWNKNTYRYSMSKGLEEAVMAGTTTLVDISSQHIIDPLLNVPIRVIECFETYALDPQLAEKKSIELLDVVESAASLSDTAKKSGIQIGLSPHAPYTTSQELYRRCFHIAQRFNCLLTTHLTETPDEVEFLQTFTGPLRNLYDRLGYDLSTSLAPTLNPATYALSQMETHSAPVLIAHGTYFDDTEIALVKEKGASVAYCPRCTHEYFGHPSHPWQTLQAAGIPVCLGTDSLASNSSLSIRDEIEYLIKRHPDVDPKLFWTMATETAAKAIGRGHDLGKLQPGYLADFGVYEYEEKVFNYAKIGKLVESFVAGKSILNPGP